LLESTGSALAGNARRGPGKKAKRRAKTGPRIKFYYSLY
jgi:hypothetical protein